MQETYYLRVEDGLNFLANDLVVHNSHASRLASSRPPNDTHVAKLQRLDEATVLAWKRDVEDSSGRLDKKRRGGGWGAV